VAEENIMRCDCKENGNDCKEKVTGIKAFKFLQNIFFGWGVYLVTGGVLKSEVSFVSVKGYGVWRVPSRHFGGSGVGGVATRPILDIYHQVTHN
jgi:hypothetical protein